MKKRKNILLSTGVLVLSLAGCNLFLVENGSEDVDVHTKKLVLEYQVVSIEVDETKTISVSAQKDDGSSDSFTASCSSNCVTVTENSTAISVTGNSLGNATIEVVSDSGLSSSVTVRVFDPMILMTDGLLIKYVDQFTWIWDDSGSGADDNGSYWEPVVPAGYHALGSIGRGGWSNPNGDAAVIVVKELNGSDALAEPTDYTLIWQDSGSGADDDVSFWLPNPPQGYVACGVVAQSGWGEPSVDRVRCVRSDLAANAKVGNWIWDDSGSGASSDFGSWEIDCPDVQNSAGMAYLKAGTFVGTNSHSAPSSHSALYVLNIHLPLVLDVPETTYVPTLDSADEPDQYTETYLAKMVAVPFPLVIDDSYTLHQKVSTCPIYRVKREEFYEKAYFYNNMQGSTPIFHTVTTTTGISQTESTSYSHQVGISITAESGCELIGGTVSVSVSYQFGYETSDSLTVFSEETVSQQVEIAPQSVGCLWHKTTRFSMLRNVNNWETVAGSTKNVKINSFVKGEYKE
jgi:hypothetical protein